MTRGGAHIPEAGVPPSPTGAEASFASTRHGSGAGAGRGADCDAGTQRARCAGAFGGNSAVSGSAALFLFNEAAEQVGGRVRAGSRRTGVRRESVGGMRARAAKGAALNPSVRARFRGPAEQGASGGCS